MSRKSVKVFWIRKPIKHKNKSPTITSNHNPGAKDVLPLSWPPSSSAWSGSGTTPNPPAAAPGFPQPADEIFKQAP